jgi:hypothetical protein
MSPWRQFFRVELGQGADELLHKIAKNFVRNYVDNVIPFIHVDQVILHFPIS